MGWTLDELAGRTGISKPYLSLIENGRVPNPPSDEKLRRLEKALAFGPGELITQAHLHRTPRDVRAVLQGLVSRERQEEGRHEGGERQEGTEARRHEGTNEEPTSAGSTMSAPFVPSSLRAFVPSSQLSTQHSALSTDLDDAYLSGLLHEMVERAAGNVEQVRTNAVPVINRVSAGYPKDFTDLSYPRGVADDYVGAPDVRDADAFAARVSGDSMTPKYAEGDIVVFSPAAAVRDGDDCFVRFANGHTTFKRIFFETGDANAPIVRLQPRNEKYRPQTVPAAELSGLYRAVYRYQRVDED